MLAQIFPSTPWSASSLFYFSGTRIKFAKKRNSQEREHWHGQIPHGCGQTIRPHSHPCLNIETVENHVYVMTPCFPLYCQASLLPNACQTDGVVCTAGPKSTHPAEHKTLTAQCKTCSSEHSHLRVFKSLHMPA